MATRPYQERNGRNGNRRSHTSVEPSRQREITRHGGQMSDGGGSHYSDKQYCEPMSREDPSQRGAEAPRGRDDAYKDEDREHGADRSGGRGFASMDPELQRDIASRGGRASHESGHAHEWNSEEARRYGREGGSAAHERGTAHEWDSEEARQAGRRGGQARGRSSRSAHDDDSNGHGRRMSRSEAGRRGAEARWNR